MKLVKLVTLICLWQISLAQVAPLPEDARFDAETTFVTDSAGESLQAMIDALARTVGLTPIVDSVPATVITYNVDEEKPFRQIWNIVLTQYGLDYVLQDNDVVVVGTTAAIAALKDPTQAVAEGATLNQRFFRVNADPNSVADIVRQAVPGIDISILETIQSISARGTAAQLDQVQATLDEFGFSQEVELVLRTYPLSNATAESVAAALQASLNLSSTDGEGNEQLLQSAGSIQAFEPTNSILVSAPSSVHAQIVELLPQLDIAQPQVNVQVRIQEITTRSANNLGINLSAGIGNFAATFLDTGLEFIFDAQNAISGLNIGAVLDTLETQGLSRRVDDTNLTVLNNGVGTMQSGGRIEVQFGGENGEIDFRTIEFGVIITLSPRISNDGRIILDVSAEVSDLLTPLTEGGIPQRIDFSQRKVDSNVTLAPGQTVLLGGLLQNQFTSNESGVPVLSSIPVVGNLFKDTFVESENTELLLIITADIIN